MTREVYMGARRWSLPSPSTVGEYPPLAESPKALVLFFDTPEECAAFERFLLALTDQQAAA